MSFIDTLAYPPEGGRVKQVILGVIVPAAVGYFAWKTWSDQQAVWYGGQASMQLKGQAAQAIAVCYLGVALFFHFRWFWGMFATYRIFEIGTILAILTSLGGCVTAAYFTFR